MKRLTLVPLLTIALGMLASGSAVAEKHALLVGVSQYPSLDRSQWLAGPVNDVALAKQVLTNERFKFAPQNVITLAGWPAKTSERPTRKNIAKAFADLASKAKKDDVVFILMSGHGSQQPANDDKNDIETDGLDEVFLPADTTKWDPEKKTISGAIIDDEIKEWTDKIRSKGALVWIIFDSCHSGTMTDDGDKWLYVWDAENRLTTMETRPGITPRVKFEYQYDYLNRRIWKRKRGFANGSWQIHGTSRYCYDGWNVIDETSASASVRKEYVWGLDLSGSMQGAGGVGGMLMCHHTSNSGANFTASYPTYDGNGNISELLSSTGAVQTHYEYDAFGNTIINTGGNLWNTPSSLVGYRFSTKPYDSETGLYYYGYRYYDPVTGRWPSRDPIQEDGGMNLYGFVGNDGVDQIDVLGQEPFTVSHKEPDGTSRSVTITNKTKTIISPLSLTCDCGEGPTMLVVKASFGFKLGAKAAAAGGIAEMSITGEVSLRISCDLSKYSTKTKDGGPGRITKRLEATLKWNNYNVRTFTPYRLFPRYGVSTNIHIQSDFDVDLSEKIMEDTSSNCCPKEEAK